MVERRKKEELEKFRHEAAAQKKGYAAATTKRFRTKSAQRAKRSQREAERREGGCSAGVNTPSFKASLGKNAAGFGGVGGAGGGKRQLGTKYEQKKRRLEQLVISGVFHQDLMDAQQERALSAAAW
jgi:hypothetical protein